MSVSIFPLSHKRISIGKRVDALSVFLPVFPLSFILVSIRKKVCALSVLFAFLPFSFIAVSIRKKVCAFSVFFASVPTPIIACREIIVFALIQQLHQNYREYYAGTHSGDQHCELIYGTFGSAVMGVCSLTMRLSFFNFTHIFSFRILIALRMPAPFSIDFTKKKDASFRIVGCCGTGNKVKTKT